MGYYIAYGSCICCKSMFSFNPDKVPSTTALTGSKEPVCESCMIKINTKRIAMDLEPFVILPGAYDVQDENDDSL